MENRYKLLSQLLIDLYDLTRAGGAVMAFWSVPPPCSGCLESGPCVRRRVDGRRGLALRGRGSPSKPHHQLGRPGKLGHAVLQGRETRVWKEGEEGGPTAPRSSGTRRHEGLGRGASGSLGREPGVPGGGPAIRFFDEEEVEYIELLANQPSTAVANLEGLP